MKRCLLCLTLWGISGLFAQNSFSSDAFNDLPQLPDTLAVLAGDDFRISENRIPVVSKETGWVGFADHDGKLVIPCIFSRVGPFSEGKAFAAILHNTFMSFAGTNQVGYIDTIGNWSILLPDSLANLENGCYFHGMAFSKGEAQMIIFENDGDCANRGSIRISEDGVIEENWQ